jgi:hypothetical protein
MTMRASTALNVGNASTVRRTDLQAQAAAASTANDLPSTTGRLVHSKAPSQTRHIAACHKETAVVYIESVAKCEESRRNGASRSAQFVSLFVLTHPRQPRGHTANIIQGSSEFGSYSRAAVRRSAFQRGKRRQSAQTCLKCQGLTTKHEKRGLQLPWLVKRSRAAKNESKKRRPTNWQTATEAQCRSRVPGRR